MYNLRKKEEAFNALILRQIHSAACTAPSQNLQNQSAKDDRKCSDFTLQDLKQGFDANSEI